MTFDELWLEVKDWSTLMFGTAQERDPEGPMKHLIEEAQEVLNDPENIMEWADVQILLMDCCWRSGIRCSQLLSFVFETMTLPDTSPLLSQVYNLSLCAKDSADRLKTFGLIQITIKRVARNYGLSMTALLEACKKKMTINKAREWPMPVPGEPTRHIKEAP